MGLKNYVSRVLKRVQFGNQFKRNRWYCRQLRQRQNGSIHQSGGESQAGRVKRLHCHPPDAHKAGRTQLQQFVQIPGTEVDYPERQSGTRYLLLLLSSYTRCSKPSVPQILCGPPHLQTRRGFTNADIPLPHRSLQGLLTILLVILWTGERWLSERKTREKR